MKMLKSLIIGLCLLLTSAAQAACGDAVEIAAFASVPYAVGHTTSGESFVITIPSNYSPASAWFLYNLENLKEISVLCGGGPTTNIDGLVVSVDVECAAYADAGKVRTLTLRGSARVNAGAFDVVSQSISESAGNPILAQASASVEANATDLFVQVRGVPGHPLYWVCRAPSTFAYKAVGGF
jgi:hypothetical protein